MARNGARARVTVLGVTRLGRTSRAEQASQAFTFLYLSSSPHTALKTVAEEFDCDPALD
jgi:hypothetical protein